MRTIAAKHSNQPGYQHVMALQDSFQISGPNGTHECLVLELLGPSVADLLDAHSGTERLSGTLAKTIAKQTLFGLCFLHEQEIAHAGIL
jgi:serine/threonine-protein kinase SRPK3